MRIIRHFFKKPLRAILVLVAGGAFIGWIVSIAFPIKSPVELIAVSRGTITQDVRVTGQLKPVQSVALGFERGGKVSRIFARVGDLVAFDQPIVELDVSELLAGREEAYARVASAEAKLNELRNGPRPEELQIAESKMGSAKIAVQESQKNLVATVFDAYTKADDAVRNKVDVLFLNPRTSPQLVVTISDSKVKSDLESGRFAVEEKFTAWNISLQIFSTSSDLAAYEKTAAENLALARVLLDNATLALNTLTTNVSLTQATIDAWRANVSSARSAIGTAIANLINASEALKTNESNFFVVEREYELTRAGATSDQIVSEEASVNEIRASLKLIETQIASMTLRAPFNGIVTAQDGKIGEIVSPNVSLVSIISGDTLQIEANVPEIDIGKLASGNTVLFTVDALPGETFAGKLIHIDPAETIIDGVSNFKIKISLDKSDSRFKSGLTVNLEIQTLQKNNVLLLPQYAIVENDEGTFVRKIENGRENDAPVVIGIRSQNGFVEIISGVTEGERVVNVGFKNGKNK